MHSKALKRTRCFAWAWLALVAQAAACSSSNDDGLASGGESDEGSGSGGKTTPGGTGSGGSSAQGPGMGGATPPEMEQKVEVEAPRPGARFVFAANSRRDTVAVIDSATLVIRTVQVGDQPAYLTTVDQQDIALVINAGSSDVSIIRTAGGTSTVSTVPVGVGVNRLSVSPDGRHAVIWYDSRRDGGFGAASGSFQDAYLIRLGAPGDQVIPLTVGFRPSEVSFAADGSAAFVITQDGVSIIRFAQVTGPTLLPLVPLGNVGAERAQDVFITPDGKYALARQDGASTLTLVDLVTGALSTTDLGGPVTDLDVLPDGRSAVAIVREKAQMVTLPLPQGFADPQVRLVQTFPNETVGSAAIAPDGRTALLFTTVGDVKRALIAAVDGTSPARPVALQKSIRGVAISPDSKVAVILHAKAAGDPRAVGATTEQVIERSFGYSALSFANGFAKLQLTEAEVGQLVFVPDAAFLLLRDDSKDVRVTQRLNLQSFVHDNFVMGSPPLSLAALAGSDRIFVNQLHPAGRLSFINWKTSEVASVTGFELNGGIRQ